MPSEGLPIAIPPQLPCPDRGEVWFYSRGDDAFGPVSFQRLVFLRESGELAVHELIWQPHFPDWRPVSQVPGLKADHGLWRKGGEKAEPLTPAERFPLLILIGFTVFVVLHFVLLDVRLSAQVLVDGSEPASNEGPTYELEVCHAAAVEKAFIAVAYFDSAIGDWMTRGWYPTTSGECQILLRGVRGRVFVFAESRDGRHQWIDASPLREFCVHPREAFLQPQKKCSDVNAVVRRQHFMALEMPPDGGRVTWRLQEPDHE